MLSRDTNVLSIARTQQWEYWSSYKLWKCHNSVARPHIFTAAEKLHIRAQTILRLIHSLARLSSTTACSLPNTCHPRKSPSEPSFIRRIYEEAIFGGVQKFWSSVCLRNMHVHNGQSLPPTCWLCWALFSSNEMSNNACCSEAPLFCFVRWSTATSHAWLEYR